MGASWKSGTGTGVVAFFTFAGATTSVGTSATAFLAARLAAGLVAGSSGVVIGVGSTEPSLLVAAGLAARLRDFFGSGAIKQILF